MAVYGATTNVLAYKLRSWVPLVQLTVIPVLLLVLREPLTAATSFSFRCSDVLYNKEELLAILVQSRWYITICRHVFLLHNYVCKMSISRLRPFLSCLVRLKLFPSCFKTVIDRLKTQIPRRVRDWFDFNNVSSMFNCCNKSE